MTSLDHNHIDHRDMFCWICHKKGPNIPCLECFRSFHEKCLQPTDGLRMNETKTSLMCCTVCFTKETWKQLSVGMKNHLKMLKYTMDDILDNPDFCIFEDLSALKKGSNYRNVIVNPIDLDEIEQNIRHELYDSFYAFIVDIDCIYHNFFVYYGGSDDRTQIAKSLCDMCSLAADSISSCTECYENKHLHPKKWHTLTCSKPHLILWAKLRRTLDFWPSKKGFTHWPAKLITTNHESQEIKVVFFESSEFVDILAHDCWIYSTKSGSILNQIYRPNYIEATLKEVDLYGENVEKKFGRFNKDLEAVIFEPNRLNDHMGAMFPDYDGLALPTADECAERPAKRPRDSTNGLAENRKRMLTLIENELAEIENVNSLEVNRLRGALADAQDSNRKLKDDLRMVSSDRDQTKEAMARAKDEHIKEIASYKKKITESKTKAERALDRLAKKSSYLKFVKKIHTNDLAQLKMVHDHKMCDAKASIAEKQEKNEMIRSENEAMAKQLSELHAKWAYIDQIQEEKKSAEERLQRAMQQHTSEMETLKTQLNDRIKSSINLQLKLEKEHNQQLDQLRKQHEEQLVYAENRILLEIENLKTEQTQKLNSTFSPSTVRRFFQPDSS